MKQSNTQLANDKQVGGSHYKKFKIEIWDFIEQNNIPYLEGNAIKYIARWREKGGRDDIKKAIHYLEKLLEVAEREELGRQMDDLLRTMRVAGDPIPAELNHLVTSDAGLVGGMYGTLRDDDEDAHVIDPTVRGG